MLFTGESLIIVGRLLGVSTAAGLNLYATVAVLGLASRLGFIEGLPTGLRGLEGSLVIGSAVLLFLVEAVIDKVRHADSVWDTIHTFIRPPAAALLALSAMWGAPLHLQMAGALFAGLVAFIAHGSKAGLRVALNTGPHAQWGAIISFVEDIAAIGLALAALRYPEFAGLAGLAVLGLALVMGPRLWRAFLFGIRAIRARVRRFFGRSGWRDIDELPGDLQRLLDPTPPGTAAPRGTRAATRDIDGVGAYANGWLIIQNGGPCFLYRTMFGGRKVHLPAIRTTRVEYGLWADTVRVRHDDGEYTLLLLKDGPAAELASADLAPAAP